jgi:hypothetical protein
VLGAVLRAATGESLSGYLTPRLWQAIGARDRALWRTDRTGLEVASGNFNATLEDYGRLGVVLANDGARPDLPAARPLVSREFLLDATDWKRVPEAFRPGRATPYFGYGYQFWLYPGERRRFALLGVYGQHIFVDPGLRLVWSRPAPTSWRRRARPPWRASGTRSGGAWWATMASGSRLQRRASAAMAATSSGARRMLRAAQFSSRWATDEVPGMGSMTGERASSQARAIWAGVAPWRAAASSRAPWGRP